MSYGTTAGERTVIYLPLDRQKLGGRSHGRYRALIGRLVVADVFVSYKREDRLAADRIVSRLAEDGYSVWWDSSLEAGENFGESIAQEIDGAKCVVVIWSKSSVDSKWVYAEATEADNQGKLVPVTIEACRVRPPFNILHCFNLAGENEQADGPVWQALLKHIRSFATPTGSAPDHGDDPDRPSLSSLPAKNKLNFLRIPRGTCEHREETSGPLPIVIDYDFAIGKFPVTVAEWEAAIAAGLTITPPRDPTEESGKTPVVNVSWEDAMQYAAWLSQDVGKTIRLPSEAEWEYACRANSPSAFSFGEALNHKQAACRFAGIAGHALPKGPVPVGSFPPNAFGLYDMHGNVWEWTMDCWQPSLAHARLDGSPLLDGDYETRVIRGGSWAHPPENAGCGTRGHARKSSRNRFTGFRLVMECE
jgi:formylglycine-generating enzyme required for sulfatase activity